MIAAAGGLVLLSACESKEERQADRVEHEVERQAEASARAAGAAVAALGLTETQLLDADLVDTNGVDIGDVEAVLRDSSGNVDRLLVEVDGPSPERYVEIATTGLTTRPEGDDVDVVTTMTRADLDALPAATLPAGSRTSSQPTR